MALQDSNGVFLLYTNSGNIINFGPLEERGGTRADLGNPPINCEYTGYFRGGSSDNNAAKFRGGRHTDSAQCDGCCYDPGCPSNGGAVDYRTECPHPEYCDASVDAHESSCPSFSNFNGMKAIVWNTSNNCVHWEIWVDSGNSDSAPANQWSRAAYRTDCSGDGCLSACGGGPLLQPRGGTSSFTWRCDGAPDSKWLSAVELIPGNSAPPAGGGGTTPPGSSPGTGGSGPGTPGTGGSGPGSIPGGGFIPGGNTGEPSPNPGTNPGSGGGGGGAGNDFNTGTGGSAQAFAQGGCAIATAGGRTVTAGDCTGAGTGGTVGNPGDGGLGGATESKPIVTVYKDLALLYNIRVDLFDNCTIQGDANITNFEEVYSVQPVQGEYLTLFQNSITTFIGTKLHSQRSALYKKKLRKVTVTMKRSTGVALTGNLVMQIRDRNGNIMHEFDTVIDPATIGLNDDQYSFESLENDYKLDVGDMVVLSYADGGDSTNHILIAHAPGADAFDGFNTIFIESQSGLSYDADQLADFACQMFI